MKTAIADYEKASANLATSLAELDHVDDIIQIEKLKKRAETAETEAEKNAFLEEARQLQRQVDEAMSKAVREVE